ncbi:UNVERIFIED_CONTAM: hypothetical protein K2H54_074184, partial [Gekko kuhli]
AIIDRLAGIERRLDGSAASAQNDMSSLELFQAEVLHRLDAIEQRSAGASSSSVSARNEDAQPVRMEVEAAGRQDAAQQEVVAGVTVRESVAAPPVAAAAPPVATTAPPVGAGVQPAEGTGVPTSTVNGPALASAGATPPSGSGQQ